MRGVGKARLPFGAELTESGFIPESDWVDLSNWYAAYPVWLLSRPPVVFSAGH